MKLVKELGMLLPKPTSKQTARYGLYECPDCNKHIKMLVSNVNRAQKTNREVKCKRCASLNNTKGETHGLYYTYYYGLWRSVLRRCYDINSVSYKQYGALGVTVCKEWREDVKCFTDWCKQNGYKKGLQLDKDELSLKLNIYPPVYSPETCQFITPSKNTRISYVQRPQINALKELR